VTKEELKHLALRSGFDKVGIAATAAAKAPPAWTQSVIVVGLATLDEAFDYQISLAYEGKRRWHKVAYQIIVAQAFQTAAVLQRLGFRAEPLIYEDSISVIDLKEAAAAAGLGAKGLNGLLITPEYGPRVRLGAIFTDAAVEPDRPRDEYPCSSCTRCWGACPTKALGPDGLDRSLCLGEFAPDAAMIEEQKRLLKAITPRTRRQCIACVTACPIGKVPTETFYAV
jgi:epoxyqueuosine reductase